MGMPSDVLLSAGFPNVPIELSSTRLAEKANVAHHPFSLSEMKNLVQSIREPLAVFTYGDKNKSQNVIVEIQHDGKNFVVGIHFNQHRRGIIVSDIRGLYPKDNAEWLNWVSQGKLLYADKEKIQTLIDKQRRTLAEVGYLDLDDVAKIVKDFNNPDIPGNNFAGGQRFSLPEIREERREDKPVFYSNAERAVESVQQEKANAGQWLAMIKKQGGLKAAEDKWIGLSDWLESRKGESLTKNEVLDYIRENDVQVEEVSYSNDGLRTLQTEYDELVRENDGDYDAAWDEMIERYGEDIDYAIDHWGGELSVKEEDYLETISSDRGINDTRLGYTTQGLDNKREIALTVPDIEPYSEHDTFR